MIKTLGSLPGDFDTTDNPGFNPGGGTGGDTGLPSNFDDGPLNPFDNFPGGNGLNGGGDNIDNNIDTGDDNDVNCDYLGTCYDGMLMLLWAMDDRTDSEYF